MRPIITSSIPVYNGIRQTDGILSTGTNRLNQAYRDPKYAGEYYPEGITAVSDRLYERLDRKYSLLLEKLLKDFDCRRNVLHMGIGRRYACYPVTLDNRKFFLRLDRFFIGKQCCRFIYSGLEQEQFFTCIEELDNPDFSIPDYGSLKDGIIRQSDILDIFLRKAFKSCGVLDLRKISRCEDSLIDHKSSTREPVSRLKRGYILNLLGSSFAYFDKALNIGRYVIAFIWTEQGSRLLRFRREQDVMLSLNRYQQAKKGMVPASSLMRGMVIKGRQSKTEIFDIVRLSWDKPFLYILDGAGCISTILHENSFVEAIENKEPRIKDGCFDSIEEGQILHWEDKDTEVIAVFKSDTDRLCHLILKDTVTQKIGYRAIHYESEL